MRLTVVGDWNWLGAAVALCREAGVEAKAFPLQKYTQAVRWLLSRDFRRCTAVYQRGGGSKIHYLSTARLFGKSLIKHWTGTDAHRLVGNRGIRNRVRIWFFRRWAFNLAVSDELVEKLAQVGIRATQVRTVTPETEAEVEPLPENFTVISYWGQGRRDFYGGDIVLELAREFADVQFLIVGSDGEDETPLPNVRFLGYQKDMPEIYSRCSVLIRLPKTDGAANMPLEMLARGRYVIYNKPLEGCYLVRNLAEARQALCEIKKMRSPNYQGAEYVKQTYSLSNEAAKFRKCLNRWFGDSDHKTSKYREKQ